MVARLWLVFPPGAPVLGVVVDPVDSRFRFTYVVAEALAEEVLVPLDLFGLAERIHRGFLSPPLLSWPAFPAAEGLVDADVARVRVAKLLAIAQYRASLREPEVP